MPSLALSDEATVMYLCSTAYEPGREHGIHPLDPEIGIAWPDDVEPILSDKDARRPVAGAGARRRATPRLRRLPGLCRAAARLVSPAAAAVQYRPGPAQGPPPVADRLQPGGGLAVVAEHAVGGPRRGPRVGGARGRPYPGRVGAEQPEDLTASPNHVVSPELVA